MTTLPETGVKISSEAQLVECLTSMLWTEGYRVRLEVSNMGQSADVVAIKGRWITVIEAKLYDWRRAIEQCLAHEQVADFLCVAVASARISESLREAAKVRGYGILHFDRDHRVFRWVLRPRLNL